ncbi:uncharacterized protein LOC123628626 isoform X2 [Lemur catta]|uniref:uncharacterized protein LOC123628626 isoform X2 n=1 Tax=Lemur catta TaxID=9447 RepID=UPI001E26973C|nr:uncharacterized protein LOC123628626 isoform X2 [Lemur catta]
MLGPWKRPVAYLSKRLDPAASGWTNCLRVIAVTAVLVKEASKLTLRQDLQIVAPDSVEALLKSPPERWLSNSRITQCQVLLLDSPRIRFLKTASLKLATLLPDDEPSEPLHDCLEVLESLANLRTDLTDQPWPDPDEKLSTDGSSYMSEGVRDYYLPRLHQMAQQVTTRCHICAQVNSASFQVQPGDLVWVKELQPASLEAKWTGPLPGILAAPTVVKVMGKRHWIHHTHVRKASPDQLPERWTVQATEDPLKIRLPKDSSGSS